jgi:hypothetical protein
MCAITASSGLLPQLSHRKLSNGMFAKLISSALSRIKSLQEGHLIYKAGAASITRSADFTHDMLPHFGQTNLIAFVI